MAFSSGKKIEDLIRIVSTGAEIEFKPSGRTTEDIIRLVAAARSSGGKVYITGLVGRPIEDILRIGAAGKNHVTFCDSKE